MTKALLCWQFWLRSLRAGLTACVLSLLTLNPVWADDTEIYYNSTSSAVKPNILFMLDASASMKRTDGVGVTRLERMNIALNQVLNDLSDDYNVGLMRFGGFDGGRILYPVTDLATPGVREDLEAAINGIELILGTSTVGALEEAWRYYSGADVRHGRYRAAGGVNNIDPSLWEAHRYSRVSHPDSYTGGQVIDRPAICDTDPDNASCKYEYIDDDPILGAPVYITPIASECQANYVVMLSDGAPFMGYRGEISFPEIYNETIELGQALVNETSCKNVGIHGLCGEEIAEGLFVNDIITHTIGFNIKSDWIRDVATAGGGNYYEAASADDLSSAISEIISGISDSGITVVAPTVTIDQFTRLSHREEVYLALFKPAKTANWVGNLKKFKFNGANATLKDQNDNVAIDAVTGEFLSTSQSFWSATIDGSSIELGGAASNLNMSFRNMYSYLEPGTTDLTALENRMSSINDNLTNAMIGAATDAEREELIDWLFGVDVLDEDNDGATNDARNHMGDVLHSSPVVVAYEPDSSNDPSSLVFFGTNEGFLHAIDAEDGTEEYAFMPQELMENVPLLFANNTLNRESNSFNLEPVGAKQSSTRYGASAARAIDRDTTGKWSKWSVTHTATETQPWLEVDLGLVANIDEVKLWNRTDNCCTARLSDFYVQVSDVPFASGSTLSSNLSNSAIRSFFHPGELAADSVSVPVGTTGQYIRIQLQGRSALSLAEVEITGTAVDPNDIKYNNSKLYGLDGDITYRAIDKNNNGFIDASAQDKAYLYAGMRRGGRSYYALDVSSKSEPKFMWSVTGGGSGDFRELGQTWSKPILTQLKVGSDIKDVLVFGGGYDPSQDRKEQRAPDSIGRAIYFVDADTGELVWSGSNPDSLSGQSNKHYGFTDMTYSIPANLSVVTDQATGLMSQIYVGDMGGRLWRFDVNNGSNIDDLVDGGIIANFGEDANAAGTRRFYGSPDLSLSRDNGELQMNIAIGSGYRAHPLNTVVNDMFFVLQYPYEGHGDYYGVPNVLDPTTAAHYEPATLGDLYDTTSNLIAEGSNDEITQAKEDLVDKEGWYILLEDSGEKVLDQSSTFQGVVRFVSYVPAVPTGPCDPSLGTSYYYAVNLLDGTPFEDINEDEAHPHYKEYRRQEIPTPGIAPPVSTIFVRNEDNGTTTITPTDVSGVNTIYQWGDVSNPVRWFWAEMPEF